MAPRYLGPFVRVADLPGRRALRSAVTNRLTVYQLLNCLRSAAERFLFPVLKHGTNYRKKSHLRHLYLPSNVKSRHFYLGNHFRTLLLVHAFLTYVRPLLEYNSIVWSPYHKCDIVAIENLQRRFIKRLPGVAEHSYSKRLLSLNLPSLELQRLHFDLIWCYKIIFGVVDIS